MTNEERETCGHHEELGPRSHLDKRLMGLTAEGGEGPHKHVVQDRRAAFTMWGVIVALTR